MVKVNTAKFNHITVRESSAINQTAKTESPRVISNHKLMVDVCRRCRKIGYNANNWMENNMRAKTDTFVGRREANTTDADTAAFMESTDESPSCGSSGFVAV